MERESNKENPDSLLASSKLDLLLSNNGSSGTSGGMRLRTNLKEAGSNSTTDLMRMLNSVQESLRKLEEKIDKTDASTKSCLSGMATRLSAIEINQLNSTMLENTRTNINPVNSRRASEESRVNTNSQNLINRCDQSILETFTQGSTKLSIDGFPMFNGDPGEAAKWLSEFEFEAALNGWKDEDLIRAVGKCLKEDAKKWFMYVYLRKLKPGGHSWAHFLEVFKKTYIKEVDKIGLYSRILAREQGYN